MAKKPKAPEKDNAERWLVTYADLMNLLLILFIILYAMSNVDKQKAEAVASSIRQGFGYIQNGGTGESEGEGTGLYGYDFTTPEGGDAPGDGSAGDGSADASSETSGDELYWAQQTQAFQNFYDDVVKLLEDSHLENMVDVSLDDRGVVISFKDNVLFRSGQADLGATSLSLLDNIAGMLKDLDFTYLLVEGHTDTDPIHTSQYKDNMDLSNERAANVWRELVECGLPAENMAAIGYGETRPVKDNDTPENKAQNRRVVIVILRSEISSDEQIVAGAAGSQ